MDLSTLNDSQRSIVTTLDQPLFVSAGAGSGKTFTLTQRILYALSPESGPYIQSLDQVLAITFTHDAAAEIRERVRGALAAAGMDRAALTVDDAWISTIHGMCSRILREHALELGIDPEFGVLTDTSELMDRAIDDALANGGGRYQELFSWYRLSAEGGFTRGVSVRQLVRHLLELASASRNGFDDLRLLAPSEDFSNVADAYQALLENGTAKGAEVARTALDALEAYQAGGRTLADLAACMTLCKAPVKSKGFDERSVAWLKAEVADAFINAYLAHGGAATEQLMDLARVVCDRYRELKAECSLLDNNDLLRLAYLALRDHEEVRASYQGRFRLVMIDEFQDTDQQQVDLIHFLLGPGERELCTVGDAQQSIYRFRGAEVEVFRRQQAKIEQLAGGAAASGGAQSHSAGTVVKLARNYRSHADILSYVARVFDDAEGGIMPGFLDLEPNEGRRDGLVAAEASRRQALLVAGRRSEDRVPAKAAAIARRFRNLVDAGQPAGGMVLLLGVMSNADVYADAMRAEGLDCVIAGGSVFASSVEVRAVRALVCTLVNPLDADNGLAPLLQSPMFSLGAQEYLALATDFDLATGETKRRNIEVGLMADADAPGFGELPLLARARSVLRRALARVGRDPLALIARDAVNESGWFSRLEEAGAEGRAQAANVLKALDALAQAESDEGRSPRRVALAFDRFLQGKQAPGALNGEDANAVRIMTVHASKGLEFPVVAVADCFAIRASSDRLQTMRADDGIVAVAALPESFPNVCAADGRRIAGADIKKLFDKTYLGGSRPWLTLEAAADVSASDSVAEAWLSMRQRENELELEERKRLLYVAMTRAREVCILALDGKVGTGKVPELKFNAERDLTGDVLGRILPNEGADLEADRLAFPESKPGDFELIALDSFFYRGEPYECGSACDDRSVVSATAADELAAAVAGAETSQMDSLLMTAPAFVAFGIDVAGRPARDSYSYSSVAAALHADGEDHAASAPTAADDALPAAVPAAPRIGERSDESAGPALALDVVEAAASEAATRLTAITASSQAAAEDPTALGSAFHVAAQWLVETGARTVPEARRDALARFWNVSESQRLRMDRALERWESSAVRREALSWPQVRAEVPFFTLGSEELSDDFGTYAEGAIDLLCTNPADPSHALLIDYKTGGSPRETPAALQEKHALQARVYADVLHKAGFGRVVLKFVRVEVPDPNDPGEPQVVAYEL